jgi:hypothetical protein
MKRSNANATNPVSNRRLMANTASETAAQHNVPNKVVISELPTIAVSTTKPINGADTRTHHVYLLI